jgi:hypothetical protein
MLAKIVKFIAFANNPMMKLNFTLVAKNALIGFTAVALESCNLRLIKLMSIGVHDVRQDQN